MTAQALTETVAAHAGIPKTAARTAVDAQLAQIRTALVDTGEFLLTGIGKLTVKNYPEKEGRNPRTREPITIAACRKVKFKPAKALREAVNEGQS